MGPLSRIVGNGLGLATEYNANRKERQASSPGPSSGQGPQDSQRLDQQGYEEPPPDYESDLSSDYDEESWELDEIQHDIAPRAGQSSDALTGTDGVDVDDVLRAFFQKHPQSPPKYRALVPLPCPVILPQRRPQTNTRGFVQAYAPVLEGSDIDQTTWMDFLNGFHKAIKMSPWFHATNAAVAVTAITLEAVAGPSLTLHATAFALHTSVEASRRGYTRYQTNKYLDTMNDKLFKPRGLYALIMTYKPSSNSADEVVDINQDITKAVSKSANPSGVNKISKNFGQSSGKTTSEMRLPQAAPLTFPALDALPDDQKKANSLKQTTNFMSDYYDRRAQARFEAEHPESKLNVAPRKDFSSRFADPNHAANSGGLVALASGGTMQGRRQRRQERRERYPQRQGGQTGVLAGQAGGQPGRAGPASGGRQQRQGILGTIRKQVQENVLYLMVVNLPSDEEIRAANAALKRAGH